MNRFFANLSLSTRYTLFVFGVIAVLLIASYQITSILIGGGMRRLYVQRLQRCESVFRQYADVHYVSKAREIEAVITSPRFVAAVATGDPQTIANEVPYYQSVLGASVFEVFDNDGNEVYGTGLQSLKDSLDDHARSTISQLLTDHNSGFQAHYLLNRDELYELFETEIATFDGLPVGRLIVGAVVSGFLTDELERLTGFDIVVTYDSVVVAHSKSDLTQEYLNELASGTTPPPANASVSSVRLGENEILTITEPSEQLNVDVTFIGQPDQQIDPIMNHVRVYLVALALIGAVLTVVVVYFYTSRRLGRQVNALVKATQSISEGELEFELKTTGANDEFGALGNAIERMRQNLAVNQEEIHRLHQERIQSERLASLGKSATGIIHDFKSPMAVIRGTVELLSHKRKEDPDLIKRLATITGQVDQMNELSQDVIAFSRGKFNLSIEPTLLSDYFEEIKERQLESYERAGIELTIDGSRSVGGKIDPGRFKRVVNNILNNAREALKPGQRVSIDWLLTGEGLEITIADNGPGIPEEIIGTIFEPFVTRGKETGTGLGLAISKKIVEEHNGRIEVVSHVGVGTEFRIVLPVTMMYEVPSITTNSPEEIPHEV